MWLLICNYIYIWINNTKYHDINQFNIMINHVIEGLLAQLALPIWPFKWKCWSLLSSFPTTSGLYQAWLTLEGNGFMCRVMPMHFGVGSNLPNQSSMKHALQVSRITSTYFNPSLSFGDSLNHYSRQCTLHHLHFGLSMYHPGKLPNSKSVDDSCRGTGVCIRLPSLTSWPDAGIFGMLGDNMCGK